MRDDDAAYDPRQDYLPDDDDHVIRRSSSKRKREAPPAPKFEDFSELVTLKPDHASKPVWVTPDKRIFLEAFHPVYEEATAFLIMIAEPVARPEFIHEYKITEHSLYAAAAVAKDADSILPALEEMSKNPVPHAVRDTIRKHMSRFGRVRLVLRDNKFFIESARPEALKRVLEYVHNKGYGDAIVGEAEAEKEAEREAEKEAEKSGEKEGEEGGDKAAPNFDEVLDSNADADGVVSLRLRSEYVEQVKELSLEIDYPLMEEYDYDADKSIPDLDANLRPNVSHRPYQEKALSKMFGNKRARSGIIVLPCGAGKTLTGISAAITVHKSVVVVCNTNVSAGQWRDEFCKWSTVDRERQVVMYTSSEMERLVRLARSADEGEDVLALPSGAFVLITTYSMLGYTGRRQALSEVFFGRIRARDWGLLVLDEVHGVPAESFRRIMSQIKSHAKLGLTATLVREDDKIKDLNYLVGPKLYEANWMDLTRAGYLSKVRCVEVWCPMTKEFYREYLRRGSRDKDNYFYVLNPNKFRMCEYLMRTHEARGDKILIFCDAIKPMEIYARRLQRPFIYGKVKEAERQELLDRFRSEPHERTLFISRVGDTSIDLPMATVIIQVNFFGNSRRQEAQRLGRILRPTPNSPKGSSAYFYTLVSADTCEMYHSAGRQQYLVDQGYTFKVANHLVEHAERERLRDNRESALPDKEAERGLIKEIDRAIRREDEEKRLRAEERVHRRNAAGAAAPRARMTDFRVREGASMGALSGAGTGQYQAYEVGGGDADAVLDIYQDDMEHW